MIGTPAAGEETEEWEIGFDLYFRWQMDMA